MVAMLVFLASAAQTSPNFTVTNASQATASDITVLEGQLESARSALTKFLGKPLPSPVEVVVSDGPGIPNARDRKIELFYSKGSIRAYAIEHELTHVAMGYTIGSTRVPGVEEGLASFVGESLNPTAGFPYIGQSADAWATYFVQSGQDLPLRDVLTGSYCFGTAEDLRCWQSYVEGASFVRWMVDTQGWPMFWQFYEETKGFGLTPATAATLERAWRAHLIGKKIKPALPNVALPQDDPRYQAWTTRLLGG